MSGMTDETEAPHAVWREHPDFSTFSDKRLKLHQNLIDEDIRWAEKVGDSVRGTYYEQEMRMLQAERGRRHGASDSLLSPKGDIGKAKHFNPLSASELLNREASVIPYLLQGYLVKGTLNLLIAYMKTGKSTLVYRLIVSIAQGLDFLERKTERGGVLILAVEEHARDVQRRLSRFGMKEDDPVYVHIGTVQEQAETIKTVKDFIVEKKIVLVVVDSLSRFWNVMDENNNMEVIREVSPLLELARETDAAVLLVHHERKSGGDDGRSIRGGSALFGLVDQAIFLERRPGEASNKRTLKTLGRYEDSPPELIIELVGDDYNVLGTPEEFGESQAMEKVKAVLTVEPMDVKTIAKEADTTEKLTRKALEMFRERGEIERSGAGKKNDTFLYCLFSEQNSLLSQYHPIGKETNQNGHGSGKTRSQLVQETANIFGGRIIQAVK
jgi:KaiC/GvpD/RAD55 family RecA-like ATPase